MLKVDASRTQRRAEPADMVAQLASGVRGLDRGIARLLRQSATALTRLREINQEPRSLTELAASANRGKAAAAKALACLERDDPAAALPHVQLLVGEAGGGIPAPQKRADIDEMIVEAQQADGKPSKLTTALGALDAQVRAVEAMATDLAEVAAAVQQELLDGVRIMAEENSTANAVRDLGSALLSAFGTQYPSPPLVPARAARRYEAVGDQMVATLDAYGLPHDGVQLANVEDEATARQKLIEGLQRNFAFKEKDGFRVFYRTAPKPPQRETASDSQLLRGAALVNANLLRAEADAVLAALDRMPDMLRFVPSLMRNMQDARRWVSEILDSLVTTARDPMGLNRARARFQFRRLMNAVREYLERGEILPSSGFVQTPGTSSDGRIEDMIDEQLRFDEGAVRDEEVRVEIENLRLLLETIGKRVTTMPPNEMRGQAAAQLEEALTAAWESAGALEVELLRCGSSVAEQDVQFISNRSGADIISIGQFNRWVRAVAEPFVYSQNRAATLRGDELEILAEELGQVVSDAEDLEQAGRELRMGVGLPGPIRQLAELKLLLKIAADRAAVLAGSSIAPAARAARQNAAAA